MGTKSADHLADEFVGELVVARRYGRMCREHAHSPDVVDAMGFRVDNVPLPQELERQQAGVALVHVIARQVAVPEFLEQPHSPYAEYSFLGEPVPFVAAVELVGKATVVIAVVLEVGVQEENRDVKTGRAANAVLPCAHRHGAALYADDDFLAAELHELPRDSIHRGARAARRWRRFSGGSSPSCI